MDYITQHTISRIASPAHSKTDKVAAARYCVVFDSRLVQVCLELSLFIQSGRVESVHLPNYDLHVVL